MKEVKFMLFVLLAVMASCKSNENSLALLRGQEWQLKSMTANGKEVQNPQELPTLKFSDTTAVYGSAGCNRFFGTYTVGEKGMIAIKPGGATMMFCPDMAFEDQYLKALPQIKTYSITDKELILKGADESLKIVYNVADTMKKIGVANDAHGCNVAAGYTWSEVRNNCIRLFEDGVKFVAAAGQDSTLAAYVVFAVDSLKAEVFLPEQENHPVLERRKAAKGYVWNQEDDDTLNVRQTDGKWMIEQRGNVLYTEDMKK